MPKNDDLFMRTEQDGLTLDEYIHLLTRLRDTYGGDIRVQKWTAAKGRHGAPAPVIAHVKVMSIPGNYPMVPAAFYQEGYDDPKHQGPQVVRV